MEHIFQIGINVEDEKIIKAVEQSAEKEIIKMLCEKVENIIYERNYWRRHGDKDDTPLREMVKEKIDAILAENKETILKTASDTLADKLARSKAGKAILEGVKGNG